MHLTRVENSDTKGCNFLAHQVKRGKNVKNVKNVYYIYDLDSEML